jgi:hypothetical protein
MLDSGGGGGGVATPWYDYDLPRMWQIVNSQNADELWQRASGWKKTIELTSLHKYNLEQYKEQLAQAWPPERSEASSAYIAELDKLIASVQETNEAASANYDAVVSIALAVGDAKYKLQPLHDEYQSNQQKLADYNQQVESYNADTTAMPQPAPGPSPVESGRQEELNNRARSIMYGIGSEITTAGAALRPPRPYTPPSGGKIDGGDQTGGGGGSSGGGGGGGSLVPPLIPPARPAPIPAPAPSTFNPQPFPSGSPPVTTQPGIGQGPILGGTPIPTPAPAPPPPVIQPPAPPPTPPAPGPFPPGLGPTPPVFGPTSGPYGPNGGLPSKAALPTTALINGTGPGAKGLGGFAGKAGPRAMPPGGVIGGQAGSGLARPGAGRPVSRVNPPGGMIGGQSGAGKGAAGIPAGRSARRRDDEGSVQHWDPDNPWETEEGVAPVVLPPDEPRRHDPGPAIGQGR